MSKQIHNNQTITEYLLGSLPEAETERLDELSVANDEFAENLMAAEKDLVDAYVHGELSGEELERFQFHYLASPLRREKVEFAQALQVLVGQSARTLEAEGRTETAAVPSKKVRRAGWLSFLSVFNDRRLALNWGFAVLALVFLVAGGWLAVQNVRLRQQISQAQARRDGLGQREQELQKELDGRRTADEEINQELTRVREERARLEHELKQLEERQQAAGQRPGEQQGRVSSSGPSVASLILTPQFRGAGQIQSLSVSEGTMHVALRLELEPNDFPSYRAALLDQATNKILWRSGTLRATGTGAGKALNVKLSASLLRPGVHLMRVSGIAANGTSEIVGDYPFRVGRR